MSLSPELITLPGWSVPAAAPRGYSDCSLVIPTYKRMDEIRRLLTTLSRLPDLPAEVVVIDGTPNGTVEAAIAEWVRSRRLPFTLIYARSEPGLTRQRNAGIDLSCGRFVFFLDDDCYPEPGYFRVMRDVFLADTGGSVGGLAGCVVNEIDRPIPIRWRIRLAIGLTPRIPPMSYHPSGTSTPRGLMKPFSGVRAVDVLPGCAFALRREVLNRERFSEFFEGYSQGEDMEMSLRVRRHWALLCCGDARARHEAAPGGRPDPYRKGFMEVRNRYFIWKRYSPDAGRLDRFRFWADVVFLATMDLAWYLRRPWKLDDLRHARGLLAAVRSIQSGSKIPVEPPARRQFVLASVVRAASPSHAGADRP